MKRLLGMIAMSAGGWLGWTIGAAISVFTAYIVSVVGAGAALYAARRFTRHLIP